MLGDVLNQLNSKGGDMGKVVEPENIDETLIKLSYVVTHLSQLAKRKIVRFQTITLYNICKLTK